MKIYYTNRFTSSFKKLPRDIKLEAEKRVKLFRVDPFNPKLDTHKLKNKLKDYWSFSITQKYRIMFKFIGNKESVFLKVGTHDIYKD